MPKHQAKKAPRKGLTADDKKWINATLKRHLNIVAENLYEALKPKSDKTKAIGFMVQPPPEEEEE